MSALAVAPIEPPVLLELRDVVKEFPVTRGTVVKRRVGAVHAVSGVTLTVDEGETLGLVGESGCGKTTLGRLMVVLERPTSGEVVFGGRSLTTMPRRDLRRHRPQFQLMFQDPYASLDPRMQVRDILREPLQINRMGSRRQQERRVLELLQEVGLSARSAARYPHEFSGGQRQRVGLARALALNPRLVVADEPVSALDVSIRSQVLNLMNDLQRVHRLTYVVISHDLAVIRYVSDRIAVMYLGKLVEIGSRDAVYRRPAHPYTAALVQAIPVPDPDVERAKKVVPLSGELPSALAPPSGCRFRTRCPRAQQLCAEAEPPLRAFGPGHEAACHFPLETPLSGAAGAPPARL
jgi:peptide/nickel transport system ATP-binding protein